MWTQPIYDRTQEDIDNKTSKGYMNYKDMNRIEGNIEYIAELMAVSVETKKWTTLTVPTSEDFTRIKSNIDVLKSKISFTNYGANPDNPINTFDKVNTIEALIFAIQGDFEIVMASTMYAGEEGYANSILI